MHRVVRAQINIGPCVVCGVPIEQGETFINDSGGPLHLGCRGKMRAPAPLRLFEDGPQEIIEQAREEIGAQVMRFDGPEYEPEFDQARLSGQMLRVFRAMSDHAWRTIDELHDITGVPHNSGAAILRHFRKKRYGAWEVARRPRGDRRFGLFEYRLVPRGDTGPQRAA